MWHSWGAAQRIATSKRRRRRFAGYPHVYSTDVRAIAVALIQGVRVNKPSCLIPLFVWMRARAVWSWSPSREQARTDVRTVVADLPASDLDALARRHVRFSCLRSESRFHPASHSRQRVVGGAHLTSARARGRGVILAFLHHGHWEGAFPSIAAAGFPLRVVVAAESVAAGEGDPDAEPWRIHQARTMTAHRDSALASVGVGFSGVLELLNHGDTVALACDYPGGRALVRFLDREWFGRTSVGALSLRSGAPVVPLSCHRAGGDASYIELGAPVLPEDFLDPADLTAAVLAALELGVRAWPEAYDVPSQMWMPFHS